MIRALLIVGASLVIVAEFVAFLIWLRHEPHDYEED